MPHDAFTSEVETLRSALVHPAEHPGPREHAKLRSVPDKLAPHAATSTPTATNQVSRRSKTHCRDCGHTADDHREGIIGAEVRGAALCHVADHSCYNQAFGASIAGWPSHEVSYGPESDSVAPADTLSGPLPGPSQAPVAPGPHRVPLP